MQKAWFALAVVAAVAVIWLGRYELVGTGGNFGGLRLDRYTGEVLACDYNGCRRIP